MKSSIELALFVGRMFDLLQCPLCELVDVGSGCRWNVWTYPLTLFVSLSSLGQRRDLHRIQHHLHCVVRISETIETGIGFGSWTCLHPRLLHFEALPVVDIYHYIPCPFSWSTAWSAYLKAWSSLKTFSIYEWLVEGMAYFFSCALSCLYNY